MTFLRSRLDTRLGRNAAVKLGSEVVTRVASFVLVLMAARRLGETTFGLYNFGLALGFVIAQIADMGLQMLMAREVAVRDKGARPLVRAALELKLLLSLPVVVVLWWLTRGWDGSLRLALLALGMMMLAQTYLEFAAYVFRGRQQLQVEARLLATARLLMAALGVGVLLLGGRLPALAISNLLAIVMLAGWSLHLLRRAGWLPVLAFNGRPFAQLHRHLLLQAIPLGVATFLSIAYTRVAALLLQAQAGGAAVGQFSAAYRLVEPAQILPASVLAAVFPAYARALRDDPGAARRLGLRTTLGLGVAGAAVAVAFWGLAPRLIPLLYGDAYAASVPVLQVMALWALPAFVNYSLTNYLVARGRQGIVGLLTGTMLLLHAGLSRWLIPTLGAVAPAISMIVAELILFAGCLGALTLAPALSHDTPPDLVDAEPTGSPSTV